MYKIGPFVYSFKSHNDAAKKIFCKSTIDIHSGELVIIAGPSGSGKSTLLQLLKGIIPEFSTGKLEGELTYKGKPLHGENFKNNLREILFLFQNPFAQLIYPQASEEFYFSMENFQFTREQMDAKKAELEDSFHLEQLMNRKTKELSHGECQRLVLASLMAIEPKVLLLDEPTAFLDPEARQFFYNWLKKKKGNETIVLVDHHLNETLQYADKVIYVDEFGEVTLSKKARQEKEKIKLPLFTNQNKIKLEVKDLFFQYLEGQKLLQNINLQLSSGEILVLKGKNGRGKSTLFKLISGILKPQKGSVSIAVNERQLKRKEFYKRVGFIFQNPESHFFYDSIKEELGVHTDLVKKFVGDVNTERSPFLLSEGEKRRLSILMNLALNKDLFLFDEPTFGQDPESIDQIRDIILQLKEAGKAQMIISHDDQFIQSLPCRVYEL